MGRCGCAGTACSCVVQGGGDCLRVTGSGRPADPYVVDAVVDGDDDNLLSCGPAGLRADYELQGVDSDCATVTVDGTGSIQTVTVEPVVATQVECGAGNFLTCTEDGLCVPLSADADNATVVGSDGGIFTPAAAAGNFVAGCGIDAAQLAANTVEVRSGVWPLADCDPVDGSPVVCGADGMLYVHPPSTYLRDEALERGTTVNGFSPVGQAEQQANYPVGVPTEWGFPRPTATITNDTCRPMRVKGCVNFEHVQVTLRRQAGLGDIDEQDVIMGVEFLQDGVPVPGHFLHQRWQVSTAIDYANILDAPGGDYCYDLGILAPGAATTVEAFITINAAQPFNEFTSLSAPRLSVSVEAWSI